MLLAVEALKEAKVKAAAAHALKDAFCDQFGSLIRCFM